MKSAAQDLMGAGLASGGPVIPYRFLFDESPVGMFITDNKGRVTDCNSVFLVSVGAQRESTIGVNPLDLPEAPVIVPYLQRALAGERVEFEACRAFITGGKDSACRYVLQPIADASGGFSVLCFVEETHYRKVSDLIALKANDKLEQQVAKRTAQLFAAEARFRGLVEQSLAGIYMIREGKVVYANPMLARLYGRPSPEGLIGTDVDDLVAPESRAKVRDYMARRLSKDISNARYEFTGLRADGGYLDLEAHGRLVDIEGQPTVIGVIIDISERKTLERELSYQVLHDDLTGLPNRKLFFDRLNQLILRARRDATQFAILFLDLDGFKIINDRHGHGAGDQLLCHVARQLSECLRESDTVARMGGDEFALLLPTIAATPDVEGITNTILARIAQATNALGIPLPVSASIGVSLYPDQGEDAERLLALADQAMYRAKKQGGNRVCFYGGWEK